MKSFSFRDGLRDTAWFRLGLKIFALLALGDENEGLVFDVAVVLGNMVGSRVCSM
jgi:hypothetical protein